MGPVTAAVAGDYLIRVWLFSESDAVLGNGYDIDVALVSAGCADDTFEDNDTDTTGAPIAEGSYVDLGSCPTDDDYYELTVLTGDVIDVDLFFTDAEGDVDMELFDAAGALVASATTPTDDETLTEGVLTGGVFVLRVFMFLDAGDVLGNSYDMTVTVTEAPCFDDGLEDNDTLATPEPIPPVAIPDLVTCPTDDDYFAVALLVGDTITVDATFAHAEGDIDLRLYDPSGTLLDSSISSTDDETVGPEVAAVDGDFVIFVELFADSGIVLGNTYDLDVTVVPAALACADDLLEENDSELAAAAVTDGLYLDLVTCPSDDDYYAIALAAGDTIDVDLFFTDAEGDIDLELIDPSGAVVTDSTTSTDGEDVTWVTAAAGTYLVRAWLFLDAGPFEGNPYVMEIGVTLAPCADDALEDNDMPFTASDLATGLTIDLAVCPTDLDWYAIALFEGDTLTVDALFADAEGDLDLFLLNPFGVEVTSSETASDDETITWTAEETGEYLVEALLFLDAGAVAGNTYSLDVTLACGEDPFEENDTAATLTEIAPAAYADLRICDDDWYGFFVSAGDTITVDLAFPNAEGDIDVTLRDPSGGFLDDSATTADFETVTATAATSGIYQVEVFLFTDAGVFEGNVYDMTITTAPVACPALDFFEINDTQATAADMVPAVYGGLNVCPTTDPDDWFAIDIDAGQSLTVTALFDNGEGDIDLFMHDAAGFEIDSSELTGDIETVGPHTAVADETIFIRVFLFGDAGVVLGNTYDLDVALF